MDTHTEIVRKTPSFMAKPDQEKESPLPQPKEISVESPTDPKLTAAESPANPKLTAADSSADPKLLAADSPADPKLTAADSPADPKLTAADSPADPERISAEWLTKRLIADKDSVLLVDCRYPYEYEGGHIIGANNLYELKPLGDFFFDDNNTPRVHKPTIVFYCEFSTVRAPTMRKYLRNLDRRINEYPTLNYPELYLLGGGYSSFWHHANDSGHVELCTPKAYTPMKDKKYVEELKSFSSHKKSRKRKSEEQPRIIPKTRKKLKF